VNIFVFLKTQIPTMIKIGTSGYSFKDWLGTFYPSDLQPGKMLDYYQNYFSTVEINSTYYRLPHPKVFYNIAQKVPPNFDFMVKTHQTVTHKRKEIQQSMADLFLAVDPLIQENKMKGFLAQFPYSFKLSETNLKYLGELKNYSRAFPLYVEFRHSSWVKDEVFAFLRENRIGYVDVDEPPLKDLLPPQGLVTNGVSYIRFHGRNRKTWYDPESGDRYDYEYTLDELKEWLPLVEETAAAASDTYLFFNNCHMGQAVKNAKMMRDLLKDQLNLEVI